VKLDYIAASNARRALRYLRAAGTLMGKKIEARHDPEGALAERELERLGKDAARAREKLAEKARAVEARREAAERVREEEFERREREKKEVALRRAEAKAKEEREAREKTERAKREELERKEDVRKETAAVVAAPKEREMTEREKMERLNEVDGDEKVAVPAIRIAMLPDGVVEEDIVEFFARFSARIAVEDGPYWFVLFASLNDTQRAYQSVGCGQKIKDHLFKAQLTEFETTKRVQRSLVQKPRSALIRDVMRWVERRLMLCMFDEYVSKILAPAAREAVIDSAQERSKLVHHSKPDVSERPEADLLNEFLESNYDYGEKTGALDDDDSDDDSDVIRKPKKRQPKKAKQSKKKPRLVRESGHDNAGYADAPTSEEDILFEATDEEYEPDIAPRSPRPKQGRTRRRPVAAVSSSDEPSPSEAAFSESDSSEDSELFAELLEVTAHKPSKKRAAKPKRRKRARVTYDSKLPEEVRRESPTSLLENIDEFIAESEHSDGGLAEEEIQFEENPTGCARSEPFKKIDPMKKRNYIPVEKVWQNKATTNQNVRESRKNNRRLKRTFEELTTPDDFASIPLLNERKSMLKFGRSRIHGYGMFATQAIEANEVLMEYNGEVVRKNIADLREKTYSRQGLGDFYLFRLDEEFVVDATRRGALTRYVNHSCEANMSARVITQNSRKRIVFSTRRRVLDGEELTYDYQLEFEDMEHKIQCLCRAETCRGYLN